MKKQLTLIVATAIMLTMIACSGAFLDPGIQESNGLGGGGSSIDDNNVGGGDKYSASNGGDKSSSSKKDCSTYQQEYNNAKSSVETSKSILELMEREYNRYVSQGASQYFITAAQNNVNDARNGVRMAESNVSSVRSEAASAGCSVY